MLRMAEAFASKVLSNIFSRSTFAWVLGVTLLVPLSTVGEEPAVDASDSLQQTVDRLQKLALEGSGALELVRSLTTEVGPRLAGSPGDKAAVAWAEAKLNHLGFAYVRKEAVQVPHWRRIREEGEILTPFPQTVVVAALGGSVATPPQGIQAEVVKVASLEALEELDAKQVAGKIVFFDGGMMPRAQDGSGYRIAVAPRGMGAARAAPKGALAVLIRSAGTSNNRFAHTGGMRYPEGVKRIPAASLSNPDADLLSDQLSREVPVRFRLTLETEELPEETSYNVIGEIRGREKPSEIVLLGAHLDSWDLGTGAIDDGSGCAIVMEAARLIGQLPQAPRRTVRVVLFANEEFGLSGARAYAAAHEAEMELHKGGAEADFGAGRVWNFRAGVEPNRLEDAKALARYLEPLGIKFGGLEAFGGADLSPLGEFRVPRFDLTQDGTTYFDYHHTDNDTFDKIVPADLAQNVAAYATWAYLMAEMEMDLGRGPEPLPRRR
ncbi:MAG: M20/M25/M40 family metallo-hydrolase [Deltaproteobacteria bacterium]|nr:M20/M25/M40 family metallo-hydrolase [Deltaproteobacteria bacterium]